MIKIRAMHCILCALLAAALSAASVWAEAEITDFKVKTLGRNELQQVMIVSFYIEYRGACHSVMVEAEAIGSDGQAVATAIITGECSGSKVVFTAELPIPYDKYHRIQSWRMKSVSSTPPRQ